MREWRCVPRTAGRGDRFRARSREGNQQLARCVGAPCWAEWNPLLAPVPSNVNNERITLSRARVEGRENRRRTRIRRDPAARVPARYLTSAEIGFEATS